MTTKSLNVTDLTVDMFITVTQPNGNAATGYYKCGGRKVIVLTNAAPGEDTRPGYDVPSPDMTGAKITSATAPAKRAPAKKAPAKKAAPVTVAKKAAPARKSA